MFDGITPTVDEAIGFYVPEHQARIRELFEACEHHGTSYDEELEFMSSSGRRMWVRSIGETVRDDIGQIVAVQGAIQDVTERRQLKENVSRSEAKFQQLAESIPIIVWTAHQGPLPYAPEGSSCARNSCQAADKDAQVQDRCTSLTQ